MIDNPYRYGNPVASDYFINRSTELTTLFSRLKKGESTALVGSPRIGKTSVLRKLQDDAQARLGSHAYQFVFKFIDLHPIEDDYTPMAFWEETLEPLRQHPIDSITARPLEKIAEAGYTRRPLIKLFEALSQNNCRLVLLLDEFDRLFTHPNFRLPQFFALLRSLATLSDGLVMITASRWSLAQMNRWSRGILPVGSPLFNHMIEQRLGPFDERYVNKLLDKARDRFNDMDRHFIRRITGRHPFLLQAAASEMFETSASGQARLAKAGDEFYKQVAYHFDELWHYLDDNARTTAVILSLMELGGQAVGSAFASEIEKVRNFGPELRRLEELGLAERIEEKGWPFGAEHLPLWQGERWTIAAQAFTWWVHEVVIAEQRRLPAYDEWLAAHRYRVLLTQEQWDKLVGMVKSSPDWVKQSVSALARLLAERLLKR